MIISQGLTCSELISLNHLTLLFHHSPAVKGTCQRCNGLYDSREYSINQIELVKA